MPFYEYKAIDVTTACDHCRDRFEVSQSIKDDPLKTCPECGVAIRRVPSIIGAVVFGYREANQYNDIKVSKNFRDSSGTSHRVTRADGGLKSPAPPKVQRTPEEKTAIKRHDELVRKRKRILGL